MPGIPGTSRASFQAHYAVGGMAGPGGLLSYAPTIQTPQLDDELDCTLFGIDVIDTSASPATVVSFGNNAGSVKTTTYKLDANATVVLYYVC